MKTRLTLLLGVALLLVLSAPANAQTLLTNTTLSVAVADGNARTVVVASATGITAPVSGDNTKDTYLYVDRELLDVRAVSGTTITVVRGANGTTAVPHAASAVVFVVPAYLSTSFNIIPQGACTRANELALPRIHARSGTFSDCLGGQWHSGVFNTYAQPNGLRLPDPGATALTALQTNGTAINAATEQECSELDIPQTMLITGLGVLNGTTVGTDKRVLILYDNGGKVLANSATAGITTASASVYQKHAFTAKYLAVGPARYFACMQVNGTTDTTRHSITAVNDNILAGKITGVTFGTVAAITVPSTYTTALGPYYLVY